MRARSLAALAAAAVLAAGGCCDRCRCCGTSDSSVLPRGAVNRSNPPPTNLPPTDPTLPAAPAGTPKPTGAYGGSQ